MHTFNHSILTLSKIIRANIIVLCCMRPNTRPFHHACSSCPVVFCPFVIIVPAGRSINSYDSLVSRLIGSDTCLTWWSAMVFSFIEKKHFFSCVVRVFLFSPVHISSVPFRVSTLFLQHSFLALFFSHCLNFVLKSVSQLTSGHHHNGTSLFFIELI